MPSCVRNIYKKKGIQIQKCKTFPGGLYCILSAILFIWCRLNWLVIEFRGLVFHTCYPVHACESLLMDINRQQHILTMSLCKGGWQAIGNRQQMWPKNVLWRSTTTDLPVRIYSKYNLNILLFGYLAQNTKQALETENTITVIRLC